MVGILDELNILMPLFQILVVFPNAIRVQEAKTINLNDPKELEAFS
jgi:hypothetical protein